MLIDRRDFLAAGAAATALGFPAAAAATGGGTMHGLIGKMIATAGQREALIAILLEGIKEMPGCLSYIVARDLADPNAIWITEVWDNAESHKASLRLPAVRDAISRARPLVAGFGESITTQPVGGTGLAAGD
jgi:quinol monooxygenase YgiN